MISLFLHAKQTINSLLLSFLFILSPSCDLIVPFPSDALSWLLPVLMFEPVNFFSLPPSSGIYCGAYQGLPQVVWDHGQIFFHEVPVHINNLIEKYVIKCMSPLRQINLSMKI